MNERKVIRYVNIIIFNFDDLQKEYNETSQNVVFDEKNNVFKIYLTQEETQKMQNKVDIQSASYV